MKNYLISYSSIFSTYSYLMLISTFFLSCSNNSELGENIEEIEIIPQFVCENGMAGEYPCNGYDLMSTGFIRAFC